MYTRIILTRKRTEGEWKWEKKSAQIYEKTNLQRKEEQICREKKEKMIDE